MLPLPLKPTPERVASLDVLVLVLVAEFAEVEGALAAEASGRNAGVLANAGAKPPLKLKALGDALCSTASLTAAALSVSPLGPLSVVSRGELMCGCFYQIRRLTMLAD